MRRTVIVAVLALAALSGCLGDGGQTYSQDASEYLLSGDEIGSEWDVDRHRGPNINPVGLESARAIEVSTGADELSVALGVFESAEDAQTFLEDQRTSAQSAGAPLSDTDVGDDAFVATTGQRTVLMAVGSNVYIEVRGDVALADARRIAVEQLEKLRDS